ncbi:Transcriptional regulator [Lactobacillus helsingborgensis]|uniref:LysR family transcriptional regulator n=1 Tax=Lactobacillus helsingborgensis TaxID=1218494 RepID=A0A0F4M4W0_9LACO|nr:MULTISPECIES: LysR family transcriptional regulator [Lactobacillus]MCT6866042.1 LysR family transcriptional regulator [Lactobacillus panisapium]AIS09195.1 Transcriptional regulator, LysR family [Lactobacillus sp. wkB8]AWN33433.1 LysR family transcriptional regulator [Lactobacillus helsingborgensis]KJY64826.1 Transcriptional regulator [Lactobacillus helsingborgensis]MCT6812212.1 LysR family transcriptional regulator [Lactobacillus helsingborgensis]
MPKTETILSTKSLHYFLQLIDTMNYTQAAQILGITQPALTQQIKKIEHAIGTPLFGQMGKKLYLTEAGKQLQTGAIKLLGTVNSVVSDIQEFTQEDKGHIAIGVLESVNSDILRHFLVKFNQKFPDITINVSYYNRKDLWYNLDNNLIDLALLYVPETTKKSQANIQNQYEQMKIVQDKLTILTHDNQAEVGKAYPVSKFLGKKWVLYPDDFYLTQLLKGKLGSKLNTRNGLKVPLTFTSTQQLVATAQETKYDTVVSDSYFQLHKNEITLTPVFLKGVQKFSISFIYRKGKKDVPRIKNFLVELKNFLS